MLRWTQMDLKCVGAWEERKERKDFAELRWAGWIPLPFTSPSRRMEEHVVRRYIKLSGKTLASYLARRVIDAAGRRTEHFEARHLERLES